MSGANPWGLRDTAGNVYEWLEDWYAAYARETATDPHGSTAGEPRVLRGGAWSDSPGPCRATYRINSLPNYGFNLIGFRVCSGTAIE